MLKSEGKCKINAVEVGEVSYHGLGHEMLTCKYALSSEDGTRYGSGLFHGNWSESTLKLLESLLKSIEADIVHAVFEDGPVEETTKDPAEDGIPSL